jgi:hypothetical protein
LRWSPEAVCLLHQGHRKALDRQVGGRLNASDSATDNQSRTVHRHLAGEQRLQVACPCDTHPDQRVGLFQRLSRLVGVHPRTLVADVHHLEEIRVEADACAGLAKDRLVRPRRARSNHDAV